MAKPALLHRWLCRPEMCTLVYKAGYKGSVGSMGPSASDQSSVCVVGGGEGAKRGFAPPLLNKHTEPTHWSGEPSNHSPAAPLRTTAAGLGLSALIHWLRGSSILYESARQACVCFSPRFLCGALSRDVKMLTKHEPAGGSAAALSTRHNFSGSSRAVFTSMGGSYK
ncbi:unnamed protein product [Pleuronectes platessa]|uniref:Uncharacterized protein n=1 Tax=Pleuronectes platessa TaxID=8262 RepID=A0A9N7VYZ3_PLEPL|nr:unnamed protein product [Pleuronectes platessa]